MKDLIERSDATRKELFSILELMKQAALRLDEICEKQEITVAGLIQNVSRAR